MKFGRRLQEEAYGPYRPHYIAYKELKKAIKLITGSDTSQTTISEVTSSFGPIGAFAGPAQRPPEARFQDLLNFEVEKVNSFATLVYTSIATGLQSVLKQVPTVSTPDDLDVLSQEADSSSDGVCYLHAYVQLNLMGFRKITKKYDKHSQGNASGWYMARLAKEKFVNLNFDYLVELVSVCFGELRRRRADLGSGGARPELEATPQQPAVPVEMTHTTYLVAEDNIMQVRTHLAKHLPLATLGTVSCQSALDNPAVVKELTQGIPRRHRLPTTHQQQDLPQRPEKQEEEEVAATALAVEEDSGKFVSPGIYKYEQHRVSHGCLYFDNPTTLEGYKAVLSAAAFVSCCMEDGTGTTAFPEQSCLRMRWAVHNATVVLELVKPDTPAMSQNEWRDVRVSNVEGNVLNAVALTHADADQFIRGTFNVVEWVKRQQPVLSQERQLAITALLTRAAALVHERGYRPTWQTWCHRTSYRREAQLGHQQPPVYVYLDENVRFLDWDATSSFTSASHEARLLTEKTETCPYGVLSISVPSTFKPGFLPTVTGLTTVSEVWMYARYLHGTSVLRRDQLALRELPHWYKFITTPLVPYEKDAAEKTPQPPPTRRRPSQTRSQAEEGRPSMRVDVMTLRPRERIIHEQVVAARQERTDAEEEELGGPQPALAPVPTPRPAAAEEEVRRRRPALPPRIQRMQDALTEPLLRAETAASARALAPVERGESLGASLGQQLGSLTERLRAWLRLTPRPEMVSGPPTGNGGPPPAPAVATVRVEPKTFFANERTLLQWMNTAVLLSTISITLLNFGTPTGRLAGLILAPVAVFFIVYSFLVYLRRSYCLERKEPINYNDRIGPAILVICLTGALSAIILLNIMNGGETIIPSGSSTMLAMRSPSPTPTTATLDATAAATVDALVSSRLSSTPTLPPSASVRVSEKAMDFLVRQ